MSWLVEFCLGAPGYRAEIGARFVDDDERLSHWEASVAMERLFRRHMDMDGAVVATVPNYFLVFEFRV